MTRREMAETNLAFSKIVATPTPTAWSQAYSAGRLFAALSLQSETIPQTEEENLNSVGKDLISTLESEFFTLENKDLDSIKQALTTSLSKIKEEIKASFVLCFLSDNVLYLFAGGGGKVVLKRGDKIGTVLAGEEGFSIKSASGYVQEGDTIILQTKPFQRIISAGILASSLDSADPDEIAETLAPHVHDKSEGGASAVILIYKAEEKPATTEFSDSASEASTAKGAESTETPADAPAVAEALAGKEAMAKQNEPSVSSVDKSEAEFIPVKDLDEEEKITELDALKTEEIPTPIKSEKTETTPFPPFSASQYQKRGLPISFNLRNLTKGRKILLTIAIVLMALIVLTSFLALRGRQSSVNKALFASIYNDAKSKYDEGQNLKDLNAPLAQESFKNAKRILDKNKDIFPKSSDEDKQIEDLLSKVNAEIEKTSSGETVSAKEVDKSESKLLSYEIDNAKATYFIQNEDFVYFLDGNGVSKIDKGNNQKEQIIKKDWKTEGGIGLFGSNVYVLDKDDGILKFVAATESAYNKSDYFSEAPVLGNSIAMAIDGSVYILFDDGSIKKYTRGKEDTFSVSDLDKSFSSPTRIFTNEDIDSLYVLDNGNNRIVVLEKSGKFKKAYSANVLKSAKDFDVLEKDKKIFILSGGKVYQIDIK